ncbi:unnamed protein product [Vitrella brassicaformis CCMP3155]|uniref:Uncharacterized protein n=1 Tax=Vitrella brassicaformis (strain CCMP3155) TaxID=1169540 RepID=A0A0G4GSM8_VITBC|nr:unnamed protein product [Vitrella brassicaformis CCMP3155]|eukprot:CEM33573.1 unnamed protein product [Vitrella brassicaformis CCMP3155]
MGVAARRRGESVRPRSNDDVRPRRGDNVRLRRSDSMRPRSGNNVRPKNGADTRQRTSRAVCKMACGRQARLPKAPGVRAVNNQEIDAAVGRRQGRSAIPAVAPSPTTGR